MTNKPIAFKFTASRSKAGWPGRVMLLLLRDYATYDYATVCGCVGALRVCVGAPVWMCVCGAGGLDLDRLYEVGRVHDGRQHRT